MSIPRRTPTNRNADLVLPMASDSGYTVGDGWGADRSYRGGTHRGRDYHAREGTPVLSPVDGIVVASDSSRRGRRNSSDPNLTGNYVYIYSPEHNVTFRMMHLQGPNQPRVGERVEAGEIVGAVGVTGTMNSASHLHIDVVRGRYTPGGPRNYVRFEDFEGRANRVTLAQARAIGNGTQTFDLAAADATRPEPRNRREREAAEETPGHTPGRRPRTTARTPMRLAYAEEEGGGGRRPRNIFDALFGRRDPLRTPQDEDPIAGTRPGRNQGRNNGNLNGMRDFDGNGRITKNDALVLARYDLNGNGRISFSEKRKVERGFHA